MIVCALLLLTSCATPLKSSLGVTEVAVPVREPCIEAKEIPAIPGTALRADADVGANAAAAEVDIRELRKVAKTQNALLIGCAQPGSK